MSDITRTEAENAIRLVARAFALDPEVVLEEVGDAYQTYMYDCHEMGNKDDIMSEPVFSLCNVHAVIDELRTRSLIEDDLFYEPDHV